MRYGIIGTGGIGGYYGAKLAHDGQEVHFLFHRDYNYVCEHGLQVNSCHGSFHLDQVHAYHQADQMPACDVVLVALKSTNEALLQSMLPTLLTDHTLVVLIQNGIGLEADVQRMFPHTALAAGLAFICTAKTEPGVVNHQDYGSITIGNYSCKDATLIAALIADLKHAGVAAAEVEYQEARWKKAVWNMPFNGMTVALDTQTDKLLANPDTSKLCYEMMREVIEAAQASGVANLTMEFADKMMANTKIMKPYSPSMKLDYDFRRPMELYYLYTRPIEEARNVGYDMKRLEMLEAELKFKQEQYMSAK